MRQIGHYTMKLWDKLQRDAYLREMDRRFLWLAENPYRGRSRADIAPGYYCFRQGEHLVFYTIYHDAIDIIGVPHQAMDIMAHLRDDNG